MSLIKISLKMSLLLWGLGPHTFPPSGKNCPRQFKKLLYRDTDSAFLAEFLHQNVSEIHPPVPGHQEGSHIIPILESRHPYQTIYLALVPRNTCPVRGTRIVIKYSYLEYDTHSDTYCVTPGHAPKSSFSPVSYVIEKPNTFVLFWSSTTP